jgi:hypothetical protein
MRNAVLVRVCLVLTILFFAAALSAQVPTGKIFGTVVDKEGTALPGVSVEATSPQLVGRAAAVTEPNGVYRLFALTPGTYKITFKLMGFKPLTREGIVVALEQTVKLDVSLELGAIAEEVTVIGKTPLIDVKSTARGMTLTKDMYQILPKGRDFDSLVAAVPGVANEKMLSGISVDGASGAENTYFVDGTDITNMYQGNRQMNIAFEFVDEVQFKASGYEAEFGGSLGGVINVITRQGGNAFHGEVLGYYDGSALAGKERDTLRLGLYDINVAEYVNYQDLYGKDRIDRIEAGFNLGGYIFKDKLWFYGSFLPVFQTTERHVVFTPSAFEGNYLRRDTSWNFHAKLTAQPFKFMRLGLSYVNNYTKYKGELPPRNGTGNTADAWPDYGFGFPNWTLSAYTDFTFGNNILLSVRGGTYYTNGWRDQQVLPTEPRYSHGGLGNSIYPDIPAEFVRPRLWTNMSINSLYVSQKDLAQKSFANVDLTVYFNLAGEHAVKTGFQWARNFEDYADGYKYPDYPNIALAWGRTLTFYGQTYGTGKYGYYSVTGNEKTGPYGSFYKVHSDRWAFYLQDSWTIGDRLTINAGLRAEKEYIPAYTDDPAYAGVRPIDFDFKEKLAPRIGAIYDVFGDSSLKVFASYAIYYDVMKLLMAAISFGGYSQKTAYYSLDSYEWDKIGKNGSYPGNLLFFYDWMPISLDVVDPDLKPMSQREISFGAEKQLGENVSAGLRVVQKHLRYAIEDMGILFPDGTLHYYYANPGYGYSRLTTNGGLYDPTYLEGPKAKREYWAVNFSLDKRFSDRWLAGFSYTWSRLTGNYSGLASSDESIAPGVGRNSPNLEISFDQWFMSYTKNLQPIDGPLATDRPHYFKLYGAYTLPFGLTVGAVLNAMSGTPVTEYWNVNTSQYMPYNRGNLGRTPFLWFANLYAEYRLSFGKSSLAFNVNVDNIFDTAAATQRYPYHTLYAATVPVAQMLANSWELETAGQYAPNPMFNKDYAFFSPIAARLGMRFSF